MGLSDVHWNTWRSTPTPLYSIYLFKYSRSLFCFLMQGACDRYGEWRWFFASHRHVLCLNIISWCDGDKPFGLLLYWQSLHSAAHTCTSIRKPNVNATDQMDVDVDVVVLMRSEDRNVNAVVEILYIVFEYEWSVSNKIIFKLLWTLPNHGLNDRVNRRWFVSNILLFVCSH